MPARRARARDRELLELPGPGRLIHHVRAAEIADEKGAIALAIVRSVSAAEAPPAGFANGSRRQATDIPAGRPAYPPRPSNQAGNHSAICGKARISARPKSWMTMNCIIPK